MLAELLVTSIIIIILLLIRVYQKNTNGVCLSRVRLDGKSAIVTGGTAGIGLETAKDLAHRGARVIIACPFQEEGDDARRLIVEETGNENVIFKYLDQASVSSVRMFAEDILKTEDRLDVLINNAGVGVIGDFLTSDGMNFIMQVNYYGAFLLTLLLLPLLKKTKGDQPSRIIVTSSVLHQYGKVDIENMNRTNYWYRVQIYSNSKLCLLLFASELSKRLHGTNVVINSVDPGAVGTKIFDSGNVYLGFVLKLLINGLFKTAWEGAQTTLHVALDKKAAEVTGVYFKNCKPSRAIRRAYDDKTAKTLWEESVRLVRLTDDEIKQCFEHS